MRPRDLTVRNFVCLEVLRAYMAWWVVFDHGFQLLGTGGPVKGNEAPTLGWFPHTLVSLATMGPTAVNVFMILSGFVITNLLMSKKEAYLPYITRRAFRLFPIYLFCLAISILSLTLHRYAYIHNPFSEFLQVEVERAASEDHSFWAHLALHLPLLQGMVPDMWLHRAPGTLLAPTWTLSLEWQFYLVAPFLVAFIVQASWPVRFATAGVLLAVQYAAGLYLGPLWEFPSFLPLAIGYFVVGIFCFLAMDLAGKDDRGFWLCVAASAIICLFLNRIAVGIWIVWYCLVLVEVRIIAWRPGLLPKPLQRVLYHTTRSPLLAEMGKWSYSTYIVHLPLYGILVGAYGLAVGGGAAMNPVVITVLVIACWPLTLVLSGLLYKTIERPGIRLGQAVSGRLYPAGSRSTARIPAKTSGTA